jgi:phosphoheptose isomerase
VTNAEICIAALKAGKKILICGNGGSATQASHFAAELVVRYAKNRRALPCISLTADQAIITACANDFGYPDVFARQVEALGDEGDVLIALSTSGNSANVNRAIEKANQKGLIVIDLERRLTGTVAMCQEKHMRDLHDLAREIEDAFT